MLAVARLLERHGVPDLEPRLRAAMEDSWQDKADGFGDDRTTTVVQALVALAFPGRDLDVSDVSPEPVRIKASEVAEKVKTLLGHDDDDPIVAWATGKSVGRVLTRLRVRQDREKTARRDKHRLLTQQEAIGLAQAYGVVRQASPRPGADVSVDGALDSPALPKETSKTSSAVAVGEPPAAVDDDDGEVF